jgi:hypothetical protein
MCPAGYPKKHTPRLYPRHKQDQPVPLLSRVSRSSSKLRLLAPVLEARPQYGAKTSTYPRLQSVGPKRARAHDKRVTSLPSPHLLVYAQDKKICDLTRFQCNERSLIDTDRETVQPNYAPWPRDITCYTHQNPYHIPAQSPFPFHHFIQNVIIIWVTLYCEQRQVAHSTDNPKQSNYAILY